MEQNFVELLKDNGKNWNDWRKENPTIRPSLRSVNFVGELMKGNPDIYDLPDFSNIDFSNVDFNSVSLRNCMFTNCIFDDSNMNFSDFVDTYFSNCTFRNVSMGVTKLGNSTFYDCIFENANMTWCSAADATFENCKITKTNLDYINFVGVDFTNTQIIDCTIHGVSSWNLKLENTIQKNLTITKINEPTITVDNIELAQFLYLMINNQNLRNVIDSITSKVVLILGRFSEERKAVLDEIREHLSKSDYIPVIFDFEKPASRNFTETVKTLAHIARFVVVDLSSPKSVPHELANLIPTLPSVTFYPLIVDGEQEYGMFTDYGSTYPWVKPIKTYTADKIDEIVREIVNEENRDSKS